MSFNEDGAEFSGTTGRIFFFYTFTNTQRLKDECANGAGCFVTGSVSLSGRLVN
jgi:hypothetical protein